MKKCVADLKLVAQAIDIKRDEKNDYLGKITGSFWSDRECRVGPPYWGWSKASINKPECINAITAVFKKIGFQYLPRDPWGDTYMIDENEYEGSCGNKDILLSYNCGFEFIDYYICK